MSNPFAKRANPVDSPAEIRSAVRVAIATIASQDALVESHQPPETATIEELTDSGREPSKLSKLIDEDFPFDDSQLYAIRSMVNQQYACLTGAAGTGKTTTTKKLVDELLNQDQIELVNMKEYWKSGTGPADPDDDCEVPDSFIPAVLLCGFTGRSTQMIKKNFPRDWHGNIMTIHRALGFKPDFYEDWDDEIQEYRKKMRFIPSYTAECRMPWDIIVIDEAGMTGLDLWHQLWAAMKPGARIYMIGDINQLPPVHGRSVFGFAMAKWPSFELTHIHRQQGTNNEIVDNAWRIIHGQMPIPGGKFSMIELKGDAQFASRQVRAMIPKMRDMGVFVPNRDTVITPINGDQGSRGYAIGQLPLNQEFSLIFNPSATHPRYMIDAGRSRKKFAVGDKVMATKNDHEAGITNGMTGIIHEINAHAGYTGEHRRFGLLSDVEAYMREEDVTDDDDFDLEALNDSYDAVDQGTADKKEKRERGPASHIVTVRFGEGEHGFDIPFATLSEVDSLMTAYVVTCHKMQGGESQTVVIICHDAHKQMLYREWLYTAVTRASTKCILLYTQLALRTALSKQSIKGTNLKEKIHAFNLLQRDNGLGATVNVILPDPFRLFGDPSDDEPPPTGTALTILSSGSAVTPVSGGGGLAFLASLKGSAVAEKVEATPQEAGGAEPEAKPEPQREPEPPRRKMTAREIDRLIQLLAMLMQQRPEQAAVQGPVDVHFAVLVDEPEYEYVNRSQIALLPPPLRRITDEGGWRNYGWPADATWVEQWIDDVRVLPAQPTIVKPKNPWAAKLANRRIES